MYLTWSSNMQTTLQMYFGQQFHCKSDQCTELKSFLGLRNQVCLFVPEYIHANFTVK